MTKSKKQKRKAAEARNGMKLRFASEILQNLPDFAEAHRKEYLRKCKKDVLQFPGMVEEGDTVYLMRAKPDKRNRERFKYGAWKIQYLDRGNGFIQLAHTKDFDKEGAEENVSFIRSHNFPITDVWNLDSAFTLFFLPRLKVFTETTRWGTPVVSKPQDDGETEIHALTEEEWQNILIRMYEGLTLAYDGSDAESIRRRLRKEHPDLNQEQIWDLEYDMEDDGKTLFTKYFFSLWD